MLKRFVVVLAGLGFMSACGGGNSPVKFMNEAADKICKCEDMECVTKAQAELAKAGESMKDMDPSKLSADDQKAIMEATQKMGKCATDLATKAAGGAGEGEGGGEH